jgi:hypothetical protein
MGKELEVGKGSCSAECLEYEYIEQRALNRANA